jgi:hypothetical protein
MGCSASKTKYYQFGLNGALFYEQEAVEFLSHINTIPIPDASMSNTQPMREKLKLILQYFYSLFDEWQAKILEVYRTSKNLFGCDLKPRDEKLFILGQSILMMLCLFSGSKKSFEECKDLLRKNVKHAIFVKPIFSKGREIIEFIFRFSREVFLMNAKIFSLETMLTNLMKGLQKVLLQLSEEELNVLLPLLTDNEKEMGKIIADFSVERTGIIITAMIYRNSCYNLHRVNSSLQLIREMFVGGEYANEETCHYLKEWIKKDVDLFWMFGRKLKNESSPGEWLGYKAYYTRVEDTYV